MTICKKEVAMLNTINSQHYSNQMSILIYFHDFYRPSP